MGKLVVFWSPYPGCAKVTSSVCAMVGMFGIQYPELSVAVSHGNKNSTELEEKLDTYTGVKGRVEIYQKTGIGALKLNCRQASLTSEKIRRSAVPLGRSSVYLYPNTEPEMDALTFQLLSEILKSEFDVTVLDIGSGREEDSLRFMEAADLIVVVLPQAPAYWEQFCRKELDTLRGKKFCVLFGGYLAHSKYGRNFYARKKELKAYGKIVGAVPINTGFFDAMAEGRTLDYFFRNQWVEKKEENYEFIAQTKRAAEGIKNILFLS